MGIDILVLALVAVMTIAGAFTGARVQVARLVAAVSAYFVMRACGPAASAWLSGELGLSFSLLPFFVGVALWLIADGLLGALLVVFARMGQGEDLTFDGLDRLLGAALGLVKSVVLVVIGLAFWGLLRETPYFASPDYAKLCAESTFLSYALDSPAKEWVEPTRVRALLHGVQDELEGKPGAPAKAKPTPGLTMPPQAPVRTP